MTDQQAGQSNHPDFDAVLHATDERVNSWRTPLKAGDPIRHHFIPRQLLKYFATSDGQICIYRHDKYPVPSIQSINDTAVQKHFYTIIDVDTTIGATTSVEHLLAEIESEADQPLERLRAGIIIPLSLLDWAKVARWIAYLSLRVPSIRRRMEATTDLITKIQMSEDKVRAIASDEIDIAETASLDFSDIEFTHDPTEYIRWMLKLSGESAEYIRQQIVRVVKFESPGLILTDTPVTFVKYVNGVPIASAEGLTSCQEIWLPLDRQTLLVLHSDAETDEPWHLNNSLDAMTVINQVLLNNVFLEFYSHPSDTKSAQSLRFPVPNRPILIVDSPPELIPDSDGVNSALTRMWPRRFRL